ncbi:SPFH domain-containing protein [Candidatus Fermentibacteria bacterium]|nr:SPFH domain-containing protein [Candidatus Fermentibacteria bacterium]
MGLIGKLRSQFVDIIEWLDDTGNTLVYRFERYGNEIKYGAKLVVREGQAAVFINEGYLADIYHPGTYTLYTQNMPILTTLKGWKYGFNSPFKAEVYFVSTRQFTSLKWGTPGPCTMRDPEFGAVRVTAFGLYSIRVKEPGVFLREIVGTDGTFTLEGIEANLRGKIGMRIKEVMPELGIPIIDLEGKVMLMGTMLRDRIAPDFAKYGLDLPEVQVQDIGLPEEVEKAIDKGGAVRAVGNLQAYTQYETAGAIRDAASNPGGVAASGVGLGMGFAMAGQMAQAAQQSQQPATPPPVPTPVQFFVAVGGTQTGPFDTAALQQQVLNGSLTLETLVWKQGMANWTPAGQIPELANLFSQVPPPVPPPID